MSRIVYVAMYAGACHGYAVLAGENSAVNEQTPLAVVQQALCKACSQSQRRGLPKWWLGPWYTCAYCGEKCQEWLYPRSCNGGLTLPFLPGQRAQEIPLRYACPACHKEQWRKWHAARAAYARRTNTGHLECVQNYG